MDAVVHADGVVVGSGHKLFVGTGPVQLSWVPACGTLPGHVLAQSNMGLIVTAGPHQSDSDTGDRQQLMCVYQGCVALDIGLFLYTHNNIFMGCCMNSSLPHIVYIRQPVPCDGRMLTAEGKRPAATPADVQVRASALIDGLYVPYGMTVCVHLGPSSHAIP